MDKQVLVRVLESRLPAGLVKELIEYYLAIRNDVSTGTLGGSSPGKFVETMVQVLQHLETGSHDRKPKVDAYLKAIGDRASPLDDGLRLCASRVARAMYTMRNKRSIAHKGAVDPSVYDLSFLLAGAQWIMAELLRGVQNVSMVEAGRAVAMVLTPAGAVVEEIDGRPLVLPDVPARSEILLVLRSRHPERLARAELVRAVNRRSPETVRRNLRRLWDAKLIDGDDEHGFHLTQTGLREAQSIASEIAGRA